MVCVYFLFVIVVFKEKETEEHFIVWMMAEELIADEPLAENLGMKKDSAMILPQALSDDLKQQHLNSNSDLCNQLAKINYFLDRNMDDELWCIDYDQK